MARSGGGGGVRHEHLRGAKLREPVREPRAEDTPKPSRFPRATSEFPKVEKTDASAPCLAETDVAAIGHDLKSPLSVIALEIAILNDHIPSSSSVVSQALGRIRRNLAFIDHMIHDLLDLASIDASRLELDCQEIELCGLVEDVVERMVATSELHRVHVDAHGVVMVEADARRIERVVANLLNNALKYTPCDSEVWVRVEINKSTNRVRVSVIDQGPGLAPDDARRVFDKFERVRGSRRDGTGLGLYVCRKIIDEHGGKMGVESTLGKGSRFYFELPVLAEDFAR